MTKALLTYEFDILLFEIKMNNVEKKMSNTASFEREMQSHQV